MIEVKGILRQAYIEKLNNVVYLGQTIPIDDENLTKEPAQLPIGNSTGVQAYGLIQNQTLQDYSPKCAVNQNTQLQLRVVTMFPAGQGANAGNYTHADAIANIILQILFPAAQNMIDIQLSEAQLWMGYLEGSSHRQFSYQSSREYSNILILNHSIKQNHITS